MKLVALVSGGKDSTFSVIKALNLGHEIKAILTMYTYDEKDSYTFQSAATYNVIYIAHSLGIAILARPIVGVSTSD